MRALVSSKGNFCHVEEVADFLILEHEGRAYRIEPRDGAISVTVGGGDARACHPSAAEIVVGPVRLG